MYRKFFFVFLAFICSCFFHQTFAQWDWAIGSEYKKYFVAGASYTDASGNTVFTGSYSDSIKIGNRKLVNEGLQKFFIAVADANGNITQLFSDGELISPSEAYVYDVKMDTEGNIIIAGVFYAEIKFNGIAHPCNGYEELFLAKYTSNGDFLWAKTFGSTAVSNDRLEKIVIDEVGNIYAAGLFGTSPLNLESVVLNNTGIQNAFLSKYSPEGNLLWARTVDVTGSDPYNNSRGTCVALSSEEVYWMGTFFGSLTIDGQNISSTDEDAFMISLSQEGVLNWLKKDGGASSPDYPRNALVLADTMLLVTGFFQGPSSSFAGQTLMNNPGTENIHTTYYIAAYKTDGTGKWAQAVLVPVGDDVQLSHGNILSTVLDSELNVWLTGDFTGQVLLNGQSVSSIDNSSDIFLMKYSTSTGEQMQRITAGDKKVDYPTGLGIDACDDVYCYGFYRDSVYFDGHLLNNSGSTSAFLAKYNANTACAITAVKSTVEQTPLLLVPNPAQHQVTLQFPTSDRGEGKVILYNSTGQQEQTYAVAWTDQQIVLPLSVKPGIYLLQVITEKKKYSAKLVVE